MGATHPSMFYQLEFRILLLELYALCYFTCLLIKVYSLVKSLWDFIFFGFGVTSNSQL